MKRGMAQFPLMSKDDIEKRQPRRPHHVRSWAQLRGMRQADIAKALGVNKGQVSNWFKGTTPSEPHQHALAELFGLRDRDALFRSPGEEWLAEAVEGRSNDELQRIRQMIDLMFPRQKSS